MVSVVVDLVKLVKMLTMFVNSAIYCSSGAQSVKRAAEGFDMVSSSVSSVDTWVSLLILTGVID
jgi:hypothetical protein